MSLDASSVELTGQMGVVTFAAKTVFRQAGSNALQSCTQ